MRLLHTSDWQIGKAFAFADEATREVLRDERLEAITRLGRLAQQHGAAAILVAGDIFDVAAPSDRTLRQPVERMRQFPAIEWHLIPGNHDPHIASGPWDRLRRLGLPDNIVLHLSSEAAPVGEGTAWIVPAALARRHADGDPTESMDAAATPEDAIRIGLAHGSVTNFGSDPGATHTLIAFDRAERASLAYLALGDWHGAQQMGPRTAYSGTPEPDGFDLGGRGGGEALLVEIDGPRAGPAVTMLSTGRFVWRRETVMLAGEADIAMLEARLRGLHPDPSNLLIQLRVAGALSLEAREAFERRIRDGVGSAVRALRIEDGDLLLQPSAADLQAVAQAGWIGAAAARLAQMAEDPAGQRNEIARTALQRLYVLHMRSGGSA
jgi:DNA repair exonuclease SbcCD nuclease subunit